MNKGQESYSATACAMSFTIIYLPAAIRKGILCTCACGKNIHDKEVISKLAFFHAG